MFVRVIAVVAVLGASSPVFAQTPEPPLVTDRPGNGNAPNTVPRGRVQIESSVNLLLDGVRQISFPTAVRIGVFDRVELRLGSALVGVDVSNDSVDVTDTFVGAKVAVLDNDGWKPSLGVSLDVFLPTGDGAFTAGVVVPEARAAAVWSLTSRLGVLLNAGMELPSDAGGRYARLVYLVNLGYAPAALNGRLTLFVEAFGRHAVSSSRPRFMQVDAGAALLLGSSWQLDAFSQHGLTGVAPDLQVALGLSRRF